MQRFQPVEYEDASPEVREIYDDVRSTLKVTRLPTWIKAMGGSATLLRGNWEKTKACLVKGSVPGLLKELIIFCISTKRGAEYCTACHAHSALQHEPSLTWADLVNLSKGQAYASMPDSFQVAIDVVTKAALTPNEMSDADFQRLADAGFSPDEIGELLAQADLTVMFNTITSTYKLPIDPEYQATMRGTPAS